MNAIVATLDLPTTEHVSRRVKATLIFLAEQDDAPDTGKTAPGARAPSPRA